MRRRFRGSVQRCRHGWPVTPRSPYAHGSWPKIRLAVLERDGWICQIKGKRCLVRATEADHIVPVVNGGSWFDPTNLRAACKPCNTGRVGHQYSRRWQAARTYITVVVGPDATQLRDYVQTHSQPSDLVVDLTMLTRTTGDPQAGVLTWTRLVTQLRQGQTHNARAWITTTGDPSALPCHRRINLGGTSSGGSTTGTTRSSEPQAAGAGVASRIW